MEIRLLINTVVFFPKPFNMLFNDVERYTNGQIYAKDEINSPA
jgi:hypothetical protein